MSPFNRLIIIIIIIIIRLPASQSSACCTMSLHPHYEEHALHSKLFNHINGLLRNGTSIAWWAEQIFIGISVVSGMAINVNSRLSLFVSVFSLQF